MWLSGPGYRGDRTYWGRTGRGYGHSIWWATRYPWWAVYVPYDAWYIWALWLPRYTLAQSYAPLLDANKPLPEQALVVDQRNFPSEMPVLPTFAEKAITLDQIRIAKRAEELGASEKAVIDETVAKINEQLALLRREQRNLQWLSQGYMIVPDMDTARFTWIKNAESVSDLSHRMRL